MKINPHLRLLLTPLTFAYKRILAIFPLATDAGSFLQDPLPHKLKSFETHGLPILHGSS